MANLNDKLISYGNLAEFHIKLLNDLVTSDKSTWSSQKIQAMIADAGFAVELVAELPATGDPHTIYFVPSSNPETSNVKDEFMYINGAWEQVGSTAIDLTPYATKVELNTGLATKQNTLTAGQNITIDANSYISADGYVYDEAKYSIATKYLNEEDEQNPYIAINTATGLSAIAEGIQTTASGDAAHAEGAYGTTASGRYSHAEGGATTASGSGSHAEGQQTNASGNQSHAEGANTVASGNQSHAEGNRSIASGRFSHAEGSRANNLTPSTSAGESSHAEGQSTSAEGKASHTEGASTQALNEAEHAEGIVNLSHKTSDSYPNSGNTIHSIGIGSFIIGDPIIWNRKNAVEVMQNGDHYILGVGNYDGIHIKGEQGAPANTQTLQEVIAAKADVADLSSYATIAYVTSELANKANLSDLNSYATIAYVTSELAGKQDNLTAGAHIDITNNIISVEYEIATTADIEALFEPTPTAPADDEIWYTTESGNVWAPYSEDSDENTLERVNSNALPLLSNTYQNGHGVLKYSDDVTELDYEFGANDKDQALAPTDLTSLTLPHSITSVSWLFGGTAPQLEAIYYNGTVAECEEINWYEYMYNVISEITCLDGTYTLPEDPYGGGY